MGKGSYSGGGTVIGPSSNWFSRGNEAEETQHAQGRREGEIARERDKNKETARANALAKQNAKQAQNAVRQRERAKSKKESLIADPAARRPPEPGSKAEHYQARIDERMARVEVVRRSTRKAP